MRLRHFERPVTCGSLTPISSMRGKSSLSNSAIQDVLIRTVLNALRNAVTCRSSLFQEAARRPMYMTVTRTMTSVPLSPAKSIFRCVSIGPSRSEAWGSDLDQRGGRPLSPSAHIQDYLRQSGNPPPNRVKWGILTNGEIWRLYRATGTGPDGKFYQTLGHMVLISNSVRVRQQLDRQYTASTSSCSGSIETLSALVMTAIAFVDCALSNAASFVQTVVSTLSDAVFNEVYPQLLNAFFDADPDTNPDDIQEASLTLLYRFLFLMYAEDRRLLPVDHPSYSGISLRTLRREIVERLSSGPSFIPGVSTYWTRLQVLFDRIDAGEPAAALPAYNGGLFNRHRPELLTRVQLSDASLARVINSLGAAAVNGSAEQVLVNLLVIFPSSSWVRCTSGCWSGVR